jgi:hypothetical protein
MAYDLGDLAPLTVTIRDASGAPANAATVTLTITQPDGTATSPAIANPPVVTGVYVCDVPTVQPGRHAYRWVSAGPQAAHTDVFDVRPMSPPYLVSLKSAKEQLNITSTDDDEELRQVIEAATAAVERHLDKAVIRRTVVERRNFGNPISSSIPGVLQSFTLANKPVLSMTAVTSADGDTVWDADDMRATESGIVEVLAGAIVWGPVDLTYEVGMQVIPAECLESAEAIIQHIWENQRGNAGGPRPGGMDTSGLGFTSFGYSIPNAALEMLGDRIGGFA